MKDNYSMEQEEQILSMAIRWHITPEQVRRYLDQVQDANFDNSLQEIEDMLWEKNWKYMEYARDFRIESGIDD